MTIKIIDIETKPYIDPYHQDTGQLTKTILNLYPQENKISVTQDYDSNSTSMDKWNGVDLEIGIQGWPIESELSAFLNSEEIMELLKTICDHHETEYNNQCNLVGSLDDEGQDAFDELESLLENSYFTEYEFWDVEDYMEGSVNSVDENTTDEELKDLADLCEPPDNHIVSGNIYAYLVKYRDELIKS